METGIKITIDEEIIKEAEALVNKDTFVQFLLVNTVNFETAALILDTLLRKIDELKKGE